jgi:transposase
VKKRRSRKAGARQAAGRDRHIIVRGVRRDPPDVHKLARALLQMAKQLEAETNTDKDANDPRDGN